MSTLQLLVALLIAREPITNLVTLFGALSVLAIIVAWLNTRFANLSTNLGTFGVRTLDLALLETKRARLALLVGTGVVADQQFRALRPALLVEHFPVTLRASLLAEMATFQFLITFLEASNMFKVHFG